MEKNVMFENTGTNIFSAVIMWISSFGIFYLMLMAVDWNNKIGATFALISSAIMAFGDKSNIIPILTDKPLLFLGGQTGMRVKPGFYFTFWLWSIDESETQSKQKLGFNIPTFSCQDKDRKILDASGSVRWKVLDPDIYEEQDAETLVETLSLHISKTVRSYTSKFPYISKPNRPQIMGQNIGETILKSHDGEFNKHCKEQYGIKITSLIIDAIAQDLAQENFNSYLNELIEKAKSQYPNGHKFTSKELEQIRTFAQVQIGKAQKIDTNAPLLGSFNATKN